MISISSCRLFTGLFPHHLPTLPTGNGRLSYILGWYRYCRQIFSNIFLMKSLIWGFTNVLYIVNPTPLVMLLILGRTKRYQNKNMLSSSWYKVFLLVAFSVMGISFLIMPNEISDVIWLLQPLVSRPVFVDMSFILLAPLAMADIMEW